MNDELLDPTEEEDINSIAENSKSKEGLEVSQRFLKKDGSPLPSPELLEKYRDFDIDVYRELIKMIKVENKHRRFMEKGFLKLNTSDVNKTFYSHISGNVGYVVIVLSLIATSIYFFDKGNVNLTEIVLKYTIGSVAGIGLIAIFVNIFNKVNKKRLLNQSLVNSYQ